MDPGETPSEYHFKSLQYAAGYFNFDQTSDSTDSGSSEEILGDEVEIETGPNWNTLCQQILDMADGTSKFTALRNLAEDFSRTAELYGRVIISEV